VQHLAKCRRSKGMSNIRFIAYEGFIRGKVLNKKCTQRSHAREDREENHGF
jgi:hypothetical protein